MNLTVREEREADQETKLNFAFLVFSLVILAAIFLGVTLWIGKTLGRQELQAEINARPTLTRMQAAPASALSQWTCSKQEFREHLFACTGRERLGKVTKNP